MGGAGKYVDAVGASRLPPRRDSGIPNDMDAAFHPSSYMTCAGRRGTIPVVVRKAKYFLVEMHASSGRWWGLFLPNLRE